MILKTVQEITVQNSLENAFAFFCNPANDHLWRKEINETVVKRALQAGVLAYEYSRLSGKRPNNLVVLECTEFVPNSRVTFQSVPDSPFYLKSVRTVVAATNKETKLIYGLDFDTALVKFALGFSLPAFIIATKARGDMKKYLMKLKFLLESGR